MPNLMVHKKTTTFEELNIYL